MKVDASKLLLGILIMIAEYRKARAATAGAGNPTDVDGALMSDAQLAELLKSDAVAFTAEVDALIAKHSQ